MARKRPGSSSCTTCQSSARPLPASSPPSKSLPAEPGPCALFLAEWPTAICRCQCGPGAVGRWCPQPQPEREYVLSPSAFLRAQPPPFRTRPVVLIGPWCVRSSPGLATLHTVRRSDWRIIYSGYVSRCLMRRVVFPLAAPLAGSRGRSGRSQLSHLGMRASIRADQCPRLPRDLLRKD
jgi:hypothetical protein